jgi:hypothetical protein
MFKQFVFKEDFWSRDEPNFKGSSENEKEEQLHNMQEAEKLPSLNSFSSRENRSKSGIVLNHWWVSLEYIHITIGPTLKFFIVKNFLFILYLSDSCFFFNWEDKIKTFSQKKYCTICNLWLHPWRIRFKGNVSD